jgi:L-rhamnose-H+ transport protein
VLRSQTGSTLGLTYMFGVLWGFGGLTFGLAMRYLGMSLGMGVALGYCAAFGTLLPPIAKQFFPQIPDVQVPETIMQIWSTNAGKVTLLGVAICLLGIYIAALAGATKEKEMPTEAKKKTIAEFNFKKGILVATFSGIMSACFSFGLTSGNPIAQSSIAAGTPELWSGLPKLIVVMLGGFTTNFIWCVALNIRNGSGYEYLASVQRHPTHDKDDTILENPVDAPSEEAVEMLGRFPQGEGRRIPLANNFFFSALAGTTWYFQFFFYTMGATKMGNLDFASWTLHMASIIIFSTMWGWIFHEWKGSSKKAHSLIATGIATLIAFRHGERIGDAPVAGGVHPEALGAVDFQDVDGAVGEHLLCG